jgi:pimeloyl-ACP methyl ester carboxylesterase
MLTKFLSFWCVIVVLITLVYGDEILTGDWQGTARTPDEETRFTLHISGTPDKLIASVSLPDIGVSRWPARELNLSGDQLSMSLPSDSGFQKISLQLIGDKMSGTWQDNASLEPSRLDLFHQQNASQFTEHRLHLDGDAGQIGVSYFLPPKSGGLSQPDNPVPAVVLLHGSGAVPRDGNRFTAEAFARQGIAAIFFDKRGVAETEGDFDQITFLQLADDAIVVARYFEQQAGIKAVGFWGHSQGGWIGPLAASRWDETAFVIMTAGPAVSPAREAEWAYIHPVKDLADSALFIPQLRAIVAAWHEGLRSENWDEFKRLSSNSADTEWYEKSGVDHLRNDLQNPFYESYRLYMDFDPTPLFAGLKKPLLAIYSPDDESIDSAESVLVLETFRQQGKDITIVQYPGYSHSMRKIADAGKTLRFPNYPAGYFEQQAQFIKRSSK